jgi:hypothetical protein
MSKTYRESGRMNGQEVLAYIERDRPDLMAAFYPRIYINTGKWHSPKVISAHVAAALNAIDIVGIDNAPIVSRVLAPMFSYLVEKRMPMLFVAPALLDSVKKTDFRDEFNWVDLPLPYSAGIFVLPPGSLVHPRTGDCAAILWARTTAGTYPSMLRGSRRLVVGSNTFTLMGLSVSDGSWYESTVSAEVRPTLRLNNLFMRNAREEYPGHLRNEFYDEPLDAEEDGPFIEQMGVIAFGLLMALNARPNLSGTARLDHVVTDKKEKSRKEFWYPNIIGEHYQPKRESQGGTHASPRMHWRRGHFANQPCGLRQAERKVIWREPALVMSEEVQHV